MDEKFIRGYAKLSKIASDKLRQLRAKLFIDTNRESKNSILLVGDGRSGTTWVSDVMNYNNEFRYMFEPFHPHFVERSNGFRPFQYLRPNNEEPYFLDTARMVLTGKLRCARVDQFNCAFLFRKRLIKDIFAHLFLKWINVNFPDVKIILVLRHPCAVAVSKQKLAHWLWMKDPKEFLSQKELVEDFLFPFIDDISAEEGFFEKQILIWSIIHYVLFKQFREGQVHLAFYENFCVRPEKEIRRLFSFIGKPLETPILDKKILRKIKQPSSLCRKDSAIISGGSLIDGWRKDVTGQQMNRAVQILRRFQLDTVYSFESMPNTQGVYELTKNEYLRSQ